MTADYAANVYDDMKGNVNEAIDDAEALTDNADDILPKVQPLAIIAITAL